MLLENKSKYDYDDLIEELEDRIARLRYLILTSTKDKQMYLSFLLYSLYPIRKIMNILWADYYAPKLLDINTMRYNVYGSTRNLLFLLDSLMVMEYDILYKHDIRLYYRKDSLFDDLVQAMHPLYIKRLHTGWGRIYQPSRDNSYKGTSYTINELNEEKKLKLSKKLKPNIHSTYV